jgi:hypothetical protein
MIDMIMLMRTTVRLDPALMRAAKKLAHDTHRTLTAVIEDALREVIARAKSPERPPIDLPISRRGGGAMPGVDLIKTSELLDPLEKYDGRS